MDSVLCLGAASGLVCVFGLFSVCEVIVKVGFQLCILFAFRPAFFSGGGVTSLGAYSR